MQKHLWLIPFMLGLTTMPFACSDSETATGTGDNTGKPCDRDDQCADSDDCTFDFCIDGFCQNNQASNGPQPSEVQTDGDCKELRCADGVSVEENDDGDTGDDNNENDCLIPVCTNGTPEMGPADAGDSCEVSQNMNGACDLAGMCSCAPATGAITVYVDGENGTDSTDNGAGRGACAYATLDFALTQSNGEIVLTDDAYNSTNATFPISLSGNQNLRCDYDFNNDQLITSITGSGPFGAGTATIVFGGTNNRVLRCIVDGGGTATVGIAVNSVGGDMFDDFHEIRESRVTNAITGVEITATGNNTLFNRSEIQGNTTTGILVTGTDQTGYLFENSFGSNPTDIVCTDASPNLDGESNGGPTCNVCMNCPF